jgi:hypothetical protein
VVNELERIWKGTIIVFLGGLSPLGTSAAIGLLCQRRMMMMMDDECGAAGGMSGEGNGNTRR